MKINQILDNVESSTNTSEGWGIVVGGQSVSFSNETVSITEYVKLLWFKFKRKVTEIPVHDFFNSVKRGKRKIEIVKGMCEKYLKSIEKAEILGQTALVEKLKDEVEIHKKEALALANGVKEYLTEEQVQKLMKKSSKNIEADFIKNFIRPIPERIIKKIKKLKGDNVFDDYVVLHYDPKKRNTELTKKEKEKKKDPILFGVIKGSRNLYYIDDWIDELCDLTLKEAVKIIEEKSKKI